jgi:hypothetical protein
MQYCYLRMGYAMPQLSPDYVCTQLTNFQDQGGSGVEFIKAAAQMGLPLATLVPNGTLRFKKTDEILKSAELHKVTEFDDVDCGDKLKIAAYCRLGMPVSVGVPGWPGGAHEVVVTQLSYYQSKWWWLFFNPWGTEWGNNGFGLLPYGAAFDEAGVVRKVSPSLV